MVPGVFGCYIGEMSLPEWQASSRLGDYTL
jgi:hypothetical protein